MVRRWMMLLEAWGLQHCVKPTYQVKRSFTRHQPPTEPYVVAFVFSGHEKHKREKRKGDKTHHSEGQTCSYRKE